MAPNIMSCRIDPRVLWMVLLCSCVLDCAACRPENFNEFVIKKRQTDKCVMPSEKNATIVNLNNCGIDQLFLDDFKELTDMTHLNLSHNNISVLDSNIFTSNEKLISVDLSSNRLLGRFMGPGCFLKSKSIKFLSLANTGFGVIHPKNICMENIRHIDLVDNGECLETFRLFKEIKPGVRIICGGSVLKPVLNETTTPKTTTSSANITSIPPTPSEVTTPSTTTTTTTPSPKLTSPGSHDEGITSSALPKAPTQSTPPGVAPPQLTPKQPSPKANDTPRIWGIVVGVFVAFFSVGILVVVCFIYLKDNANNGDGRRMMRSQDSLDFENVSNVALFVEEQNEPND